MDLPLIKHEPGLIIKSETTYSEEDNNFVSNKSDSFSNVLSADLTKSEDTSASLILEGVQLNKSSSPKSTTLFEEHTEREQTKMRLAAKIQEIKAAKEFLKTFPAWLYPSEKMIPEVGDWCEDIGMSTLDLALTFQESSFKLTILLDAIFQHADLPRVVLGFMGQSGSGKSTLINALIDEEKLLPCSTLQACTAVAVEIAWNTIADKGRAYRAKIDFVTETEWKAELDLLVAELLENDSTSDEAKVASAKISTVYPETPIDTLTAESAAELMNHIAISKLLGQNVKIEMAAGKGFQFSKAIKPYIDSNSGSTGGTTYWPLVKRVQIFTRAPILSTGLVLIDLPGSGDCNAAREAVAEEYMQQVSAICIVAEIGRALTSSVARNLFGRGNALKRRLLRDGLLDDEHLFFVLTHTDKITEDDYIEEQGLEEKDAHVADLLKRKKDQVRRAKQLKQNKKLFEEQIDKLESNIRLITQAIFRKDSSDSQTNRRKRKRPTIDEEVSSALTSQSLPQLRHILEERLNAKVLREMEIIKLQADLKENEEQQKLIDHEITTICIRKRNNHVAHRMGIDFSVSLRELGEELDREGNEAALSIPEVSSSLLRKCVATFCVCAKAYQKQRGRKNAGGEITGFDTEDDTFMPQLIRHCKEFTLNARERLADVFLEHLTRLRARMRGWADNSAPDRQITKRQRRLLEERFETQIEVLKKNLENIRLSATNELRKNARNLKKRSLDVAAPMAESKTAQVFCKWENSVSYAGTWKAICRREGVHVSKPKSNEMIEHNWNVDLAEPFILPLERVLGTFIKQDLPNVRQESAAKFIAALEFFALALREQCLAVTKDIANPLENLFHNFQTIKILMEQNHNQSFDKAVKVLGAIDGNVAHKIKRAMIPGYAMAATQSGKKTFQLRKNTIEDHVAKVKSSMYKDLANGHAEDTDNSITLLQTNQKHDYQKSSEKLRGHFSKMMDTSIATVNPKTGPAKVKLQREVLEKLSSFDGLLGKYQPVNGKPIYIDLSEIDDAKLEDESNSDDTDAEEDGMYFHGDGLDPQAMDDLDFGMDFAMENMDEDSDIEASVLST